MDQEVDTNEVNPLDMSDEQFNEYLSKLDLEDQQEELQEEDTSESLQEASEELVEDKEGDSTATSDTEPPEALEEPSDTDSETDTGDIEEDDESNTEIEESNKKGGDPKSTESKVEAIDFEKAYKEIFAPFKANGKDMQVDSIEDVRTLMQMGANYNKKMAAIKPNLKVLKTLENNGLLDEAKLNYLIDLDKKNPEAIKKLIQDSGIDPLEMDTETKSNYQPTAYNATDKEVELDSVLNEIKDTQSFNRTIDIIGNKWDERSKQLIVENPSTIKIINDQVESGIYDTVSSIVEKERMLGRLTGMSDIEAYKAVGDALNARGYFNKQTPSTVAKTVTKPSNTNTDTALRDKRKAATSTKSTPKQTKQEFNPLNMSDEEFEKIGMNKFI